ncbi:MAG: 2-dehydropantoate 2-reductase [Lachnospiraceae bacterium]|nr:2-dehydropantoate 2-reductase [Lachnospiraceae bacterium]
MRITILGAGAMGSLFGGYLSKENDVWMVDVNPAVVDYINENGVKIKENDGEGLYHPTAVIDTKDLGTMDLVVVFVKAMFSRSALEANRGLIGPDTYIMTLQNGAGHEQLLLEFADRKHVIIGTTKHNSSILGMGHINHGGGGPSTIGLLDGGSSVLQPIADTFTACGFETSVSDEVRASIWNKMFTNVSASAMTAILQTSLDFLKDSENAWKLVEQLAREAVRVANADGLSFDEEKIVSDVRTLVENANHAYTSIYADIRDGRRTEVDTISGSVVNVAHRLGIPVPATEFVVTLIHALEDKNRLYQGEN